MRLTPEKIEGLVVKQTYHFHNTLTLCILDLSNGSVVVGQSNVIDSKSYQETVGKDIAYRDAVDKIWQLEGYALKTRGI